MKENTMYTLHKTNPKSLQNKIASVLRKLKNVKYEDIKSMSQDQRMDLSLGLDLTAKEVDKISKHI